MNTVSMDKYQRFDGVLKANAVPHIQDHFNRDMIDLFPKYASIAFELGLETIDTYRRLRKFAKKYVVDMHGKSAAPESWYLKGLIRGVKFRKEDIGEEPGVLAQVSDAEFGRLHLVPTTDPFESFSEIWDRPLTASDHRKAIEGGAYRKCSGERIKAEWNLVRNLEVAEAKAYEVAETRAIRAAQMSFKFFRDLDLKTECAYLVKELIDRSAFSVIYGESNCGKTFIALEIALSIAMGKEVFGRKVKKGFVVYLALEGGRGTTNRTVAFRKHYKLSKDLDLPFAIVSSSVNLLDPNADASVLVDKIREYSAVRGETPALVVIDTLSRALAGGDENASQDMSALVASVDLIRKATGAHVMVVHHSGKDSSKGARGHSSLRAATDTEIEIKVEKDDPIRTITIRKQRDQEMGKDLHFELKPVALGQDDEGDPITSCVVVPVNVSAIEAFSKKRIPRGSVAETCYHVLCRILEEQGTQPTAATTFEGAAKIVPVEVWREAVAATYPAGTTNKTTSAAYNRSLQHLTEWGQISVKEGYVYLR
jgi:KaiC/GvpD/RAD55 family RecA-like ATPase